jgi:hypothetical protein
MVPRWVNDEPKLRLSYESAAAPWPGKIVVTGLELRGADPNVQWWFRMERAEIRYSLLELLARRFHATSVRAAGLRFRLRQRLSTVHGSAAAAAPLPGIPGFGAVPIQGGPPFFPAPEAPGQYWQVQIDSLDAPAQEIWIDQYRYAGAARVSGSFFLWPQKKAAIGPARVGFDGGTVWLGRDRAAEGFRGELAAKIAPFDPRTVRGNEVYRFISGGGRVSGEMPAVSYLNYFLRDAAEPRLSGGHGKLAAELALRDGRGTLALTLAASAVRARYQKNTLSGDAVIRLRLDDWRPAEAVGGMHDTRVDLADVSTSSGAPRWFGTFDVGPGTLRSTEHGLALGGRVAARCRDARPLYTLFGVGLPKWAQGIFTLDDFRASAGFLLAPATIEVSALDARGGKFTVVGEYRQRGNAADGAFLVEAGPLAVGVDVGASKSTLHVAGAKAWYAARARAR